MIGSLEDVQINPEPISIMIDSIKKKIIGQHPQRFDCQREQTGF